MPYRWARVLPVAALLFVAAPPAAATQGPDEPAPEPPQGVAAQGPGDLRGVYLHSGETGSPDAGVGRLALQLVTGGTVSEVSRQHRFRSGDRFRFLVSANREGWLYVLHYSAESPARLLWPPAPGGPGDPGPGANRLLARVPKPVPSPPAVFVFDEEIGTEHFYVAIRSQPTLPTLSLPAEPPQSRPVARPGPPKASPKQTPQSASPPAPQPTRPGIVQFSVRGMGEGAGIPSRGVFIDPDPGDADPGTYFSVPPQEQGGNLVFEFQLRHEE